MKTNKRVYTKFLNLQLLIATIVAFSLLNSCVTSSKITYLQEYSTSEYPTESVTPENYRLQPNDNIFIRVTTPDPERSALFNTVTAGAGSIGHTEQSVDLLSYTVNLDGTVDIPYIGAVPVAGKTIQETRVLLEMALSDYVTDVAITVKLVNNYVSILGEVNRPGRYPIYKEHLNIFQALAMAGDMANYSNRYRVSLVRQTPYGVVVKEFNLTDKKLVNSEFFHVMPNDVIYAQPMKGKFFGMSQFPYSVILSTITTFLLVLNYIQK
ncbi:MAG: polysaccharide biosynthesis/export family protein [Bacteroidales bacterium]|nr:polysaccharide biosynthesis/export family protein [Bacteroidales bacterium]